MIYRNSEWVETRQGDKLSIPEDHSLSFENSLIRQILIWLWAESLGGKYKSTRWNAVLSVCRSPRPLWRLAVVTTDNRAAPSCDQPTWSLLPSVPWLKQQIHPHNQVPWGKASAPSSPLTGFCGFCSLFFPCCRFPLGSDSPKMGAGWMGVAIGFRDQRSTTLSTHCHLSVTQLTLRTHWLNLWRYGDLLYLGIRTFLTDTFTEWLSHTQTEMASIRQPM